MNTAITFKDGSHILLCDLIKIEPYYEADESNSRQFIAFYSGQREPSSLIDVTNIVSWIITRDM